MKKKAIKKATELPNPIKSISYLMHEIVTKLERITRGQPMPYTELIRLHQDIDLLLKEYIEK